MLGIKTEKHLSKHKREVWDMSLYLQNVTKEIAGKIDSFLTNFKQFGDTFVFDHLVSRFC